MKFWILVIFGCIVAVAMVIGLWVVLVAIYLTVSDEKPIEENYKLKTKYCTTERICHEANSQEW